MSWVNQYAEHSARKTLTDSSLHEHAAKQLRARGWTVLQIVEVHPDAILYLGASLRPMTAWLRGKEAFREAGFPAWPSPGVIPEVEDPEA